MAYEKVDGLKLCLDSEVVTESDCSSRDTAFEFLATPNEVRGGSGLPLVDVCRPYYQHKVNHCEHEPMIYAAKFDSQYGERTLYFCACKKCRIATDGFHNPVEAVRAWDGNNTYADSSMLDHEAVELVWG